MSVIDKQPRMKSVIEAGILNRHYWTDLWRYRELFLFLSWRDIAVRYKQTVIGVAWSLIRPLLTMLIMTFVFGRLAKLPSEGNAPYPIMVFAAMLPWNLFATAFASSSDSVVNNANLVSKVYFPRMIIPTSAVMVSFVDFIISLSILAVMILYYSFVPTWKIALIPVFLLISIMASLAGGLWISALNVRFRDFKHIVPFVVQIGVYITPVGFSSAIIPEKWRLLYSLNPMVGVIDGFRWAIIGGDVKLYWPGILMSVTLSLIVLVSGALYFRKAERYFADVI